MSDSSSFENFNAFWPYYLGEHRNAFSRGLHYFGSACSLFIATTLFFLQQWHWLILVPIVGYLPAWVGHFLIEKNRPATFKHPFWSLRGDFKMLRYYLTGQLKSELEKYHLN